MASCASEETRPLVQLLCIQEIAVCGRTDPHYIRFGFLRWVSGRRHGLELIATANTVCKWRISASVCPELPLCWWRLWSWSKENQLTQQNDQNVLRDVRGESLYSFPRLLNVKNFRDAELAFHVHGFYSPGFSQTESENIQKEKNGLTCSEHMWSLSFSLFSKQYSTTQHSRCLRYYEQCRDFKYTGEHTWVLCKCCAIFYHGLEHRRLRDPDPWNPLPQTLRVTVL